MPSNNWWKERAAMRGFIVLVFSDAPSEIPIITECTTIPNSKTYKNSLTLLNWKKRKKIAVLTRLIRIVVYYLFTKFALETLLKKTQTSSQLNQQQAISFSSSYKALIIRQTHLND